MKNLIQIIGSILIVTLSVSTGYTAANREGISSEIKPELLQGLESWVNNLKQDLDRALQQAEKRPIREQESRYRTAIENILAPSDKMSSEFLSRNILYRAQEVHDVLLQVPRDPKRDAFARRFLKESIQWAIKVAPRDIVLAKQFGFDGIVGSQDRALLGLQWANWIVSFSFMLPTNESHYTVLKKAMGFLYNDILQDDAYNRRLAGVAKQFLLKYQEMQTFTPVTPLDYLEAIKDLREFLSDELERAIANVDLEKNKISKKQLDQVSEDRIESGVSRSNGGDGITGRPDSILSARFVDVHPGRFMMGSPDSEGGRHPGNEKLHEVTLTRTFAIQETPVTQKQWYEVMGKNPSKFNTPYDCSDYVVMNGTPMCPNNPVEQVSWNDVQKFIVHLNQQVGARLYRLPTEAEWEYAARGGHVGVRQTAYYFGDGTALLPDHAWYSANSNGRTHPVCMKKRNPLDLCDMYGNVSEWMQDKYDEAYPPGLATDPIGGGRWEDSGPVFRGGGWQNAFVEDLRSARRAAYNADWTSSGIGFRLVKTGS